MFKFFKTLYINRIIKKYRKNSYIYGEMISYAYMGKAVGFDEVENRQKKYELLLVNNNFAPYDIKTLYSTGYGSQLPIKLMPIQPEDRAKVLKNLELDRQEIHEQFKINFANRI